MADIGHDHEQDRTPTAIVATEGKTHLSKEGKVILYTDAFCDIQRKYYDVDWGLKNRQINVGVQAYLLE